MRATAAQKPPTKTEVARTLGVKIDLYLKRFERDPKINPGKRYDEARKQWVSDPLGVFAYYSARAWGVRHRVHVVYVAYQGASVISIADAATYLAWLEAGNVGRHYEALKGSK